jgi:peroxiredoxin
MMYRFTTLAAVAIAAVVSIPAFAEEKTQNATDQPKPEIKQTEKAAAPATAPDFNLKDADGKTHSLADYRGKVVVLEWTNPGCPFVQRHYKNGTMKNLAAKYAGKGVVWLAVNSTKTNTPADSQAWAKEKELPYPTLQDAEGTMGKAYGAKSTPHMFVIDKEGKIAYQGAIDDDPQGDKGASAVNYVQAALDKVLKGEQPDTVRTTSYGCGVKYKN